MTTEKTKGALGTPTANQDLAFGNIVFPGGKTSSVGGQGDGVIQNGTKGLPIGGTGPWPPQSVLARAPKKGAEGQNPMEKAKALREKFSLFCGEPWDMMSPNRCADNNHQAYREYVKLAPKFSPTEAREEAQALRSLLGIFHGASVGNSSGIVYRAVIENLDREGIATEAREVAKFIEDPKTKVRQDLVGIYGPYYAQRGKLSKSDAQNQDKVLIALFKGETDISENENYLAFGVRLQALEAATSLVSSGKLSEAENGRIAEVCRTTLADAAINDSNFRAFGEKAVWAAYQTLAEKLTQGQAEKELEALRPMLTNLDTSDLVADAYKAMVPRISKEKAQKELAEVQKMIRGLEGDPKRNIKLSDAYRPEGIREILEQVAAELAKKIG